MDRDQDDGGQSNPVGAGQPDCHTSFLLVGGTLRLYGSPVWAVSAADNAPHEQLLTVDDLPGSLYAGGMTGSSPYPPGFGAPPPGSGTAAERPGYVPQPPGELWPELRRPSGPNGLVGERGRSRGVAWNRRSGVVDHRVDSRAPSLSQPPATPQAEPQELFVDDADKALCEAIGPLMREETDRANAFLATGEPDSPERKAAIPTFKADTLDWADRIQDATERARRPSAVSDPHTAAIHRRHAAVQREHVPGPCRRIHSTTTTYDSAVVALGGPLATCYKVGVGW